MKVLPLTAIEFRLGERKGRGKRRTGYVIHPVGRRRRFQVSIGCQISATFVSLTAGDGRYRTTSGRIQFLVAFYCRPMEGNAWSECNPHITEHVNFPSTSDCVRSNMFRGAYITLSVSVCSSAVRSGRRTSWVCVLTKLTNILWIELFYFEPNVSFAALGAPSNWYIQEPS